MVVNNYRKPLPRRGLLQLLPCCRLTISFGFWGEEELVDFGGEKREVSRCRHRLYRRPLLMMTLAAA
jgi:hypothetical protein